MYNASKNNISTYIYIYSMYIFVTYAHLDLEDIFFMFRSSKKKKYLELHHNFFTY